MRRRRLIALAVALLAVVVSGAFAVAAGRQPVGGSAAQTAAAYFGAWGRGELEAMKKLVDDPPEDFAARHLALAEALHVESITLRPMPLRRTGEQTAEAPFTGTLRLREFGPWEFTATLRLAVRHRQWKVLWSPETLHPLLKDGGRVEVRRTLSPGVELLTAEGDPIPRNSYNEPYLEEIAKGLAPEREGWELVAGGRKLKEIRPERREQRLTLSRPVQAAAARALDGVTDAAIVAVRAGTGEILAVSDRLVQADAITGFYPPGAAFKIVTAAALLKAGLDPGSPVECPPYAGAVRNDDLFDGGALTFEQAFGRPCATTLAQQAMRRLTGADLVAAAAEWGFGRYLPATGAQGTCGGTPDRLATPDEVEDAAVGYGGVAVTPLCMAVIAATVRGGVWREPWLLPERDGEAGGTADAVGVDAGIAEQLRRMMEAAVPPQETPEDVAAVWGGEFHSWFVGYRGDLAFSVLVVRGSGAATDAPTVAARFLRGL
ncbi:penicillin-binding transpeptidase domain-containing protein [Thermoactinospora rubra]|uniref:penicillin-binding transpeptidase domain-containing protein n=1 Tax=Thermoactinospora rubra TaxID=1088767 RepID=UPI000A11CC98|nr:penicillin-binding transpeptidase domain-containing protein [Thermoactinospora rubra]